VSEDYRQEILGWIKMKAELPKNATMIGLTHDYNTRVMYYAWTPLNPWPRVADVEMGVLGGGNMDMGDPSWNTTFDSNTRPHDYFLVTDMVDLDRQPVLKENLSRYSSVEGEGYILFDLREKE